MSKKKKKRCLYSFFFFLKINSDSSMMSISFVVVVVILPISRCGFIILGIKKLFGIIFLACIPNKRPSDEERHHDFYSLANNKW